MHKSDDPLERGPCDGGPQDASFDDCAIGDADAVAKADPRQSLWHRLLKWLFNISPLVLSGVSAFLVLYLLAKLFQLR